MHAWSVQSFIAELAAQLNRDPKDLPARDDRTGAHRRSRKQVTTELWDYGEPFENLSDRHRQAASRRGACSERAGWGKQLPKGHGLGIAAHRSFVSYIATVVEVAVDEKGNYTVPRVDTAIDCGFCVNPERVRFADRRRGRDGAVAGQIRRDHRQGRPRAAEQLQRLPDHTHRRVAHRDAVHIVEHGIEVPASGGRGTGRSAVRAGAGATRSSPRPASASATCRSAKGWPSGALNAV